MRIEMISNIALLPMPKLKCNIFLQCKALIPLKIHRFKLGKLRNYEQFLGIVFSARRQAKAVVQKKKRKKREEGKGEEREKEVRR
jgi:hypothetical protein